MTTSLVLLAIYLACLLLLAWPLGTYLARVLRRRPVFLDPLLLPVERVVLRLAGVRREADDEPIATDWKGYSRAVLGFSLVGFVVLYLLLRTQHLLPLNPQALPAVPPDLAFNTALSFVTNTNWQSYGGETTLSYASQMLGLGVQNFMSAATGIAVMAALARGLVRRQGAQAGMLGNFWADLVRVTLYVLLPLSLLLAIVLATQGVVQTFAPYATVELLQPVTSSDGHTITQQVLPLGPAASQVAIKQLGTNGGGFFNVNSAHPFENPTALSNLLQMLAILLLPAACCFAFGDLVRDRRQGYALLLAMTLVFVLATVACMACEALGNPVIHALGVDQAASATQGGGNMEGKEARFGVGASALWATATTAASNGSVNAMHDSFTPLGGLVPLTMILLGEVIFGGVGSGLYGMLLFVVVTVFLAGLMVGRTPEYLGKRIEPFEMKMAALAIVLPAACVLVGTALAVLLEAGRAGIQDPGPHGFTEVLYAYASASNNNGSAFGGLSANAPLYNTTLGVAMFVGRFGVIIPVLAIAGGMAHKRRAAASHGTLPTHTPTFIALLIGAVLLVGALTFLPACALGPIVEHLTLWGGK